MSKRMMNTGVKGFTLVELMATVAIIGVLAAIAIPNYVKYQRKARQAEAKVMLGSGYIGESTTKNSDHGGSYTVCVKAIGMGAEGLQIYGVGFAGAAAAITACTPNGLTTAAGGGAAANECAAYSWKRSTAGAYTIAAACASADANITTANKATNDGVAAVDSDFGNTITWNTFEMTAAGQIGGAQLDKWGVNEAKQVYQLQDGVAGN